jgi:hypothetical protein
MRNLRGALPNSGWASQYGVLAGLRVKLIYGLAAVGPSIDAWETNFKEAIRASDLWRLIQRVSIGTP